MLKLESFSCSFVRAFRDFSFLYSTLLRSTEVKLTYVKKAVVGVLWNPGKEWDKLNRRWEIGWLVYHHFFSPSFFSFVHLHHVLVGHRNRMYIYYSTCPRPFLTRERSVANLLLLHHPACVRVCMRCLPPVGPSWFIDRDDAN